MADFQAPTTTIAVEQPRASFMANVTYTGIRIGCGLLSGLAVAALVGRYLGAAGMGIYAYALWLVGILVLLASLGLPTTATRYIAERLGAGDLAGAASISRRLLAMQLRFALGAGIIGLVLFLRGQEGSGIRIAVLLSLVIVCQLMQQTIIAVLLGMQRYAASAVVSAVDLTLKIGIVASAVHFDSGLEGLYLALLASSALAAITGLQLLPPAAWQPTRSHSGVIDPALAISMRNFSFAAAYSLLLNAIVWQRSEIFFLKQFSDLREVGFYAAAFAFAAGMRAIPGVISEAVLPMASHSHGSDPAQLSHIYGRGVRLAVLLMAPLSMYGIVFARHLVFWFYGPQFASAVIVLRLLLAGALVTSIAGVGWAVMYAAGRQRFDVIAGSFVAIFDILLAITLIPRFGALGAAAANIAAQVAAVLGTLAYLVLSMHLKFPYRHVFAILSASFVSVGPAGFSVIRVWPPFVTTALVIGGLVLYVGILAGLNVIRCEELREFVAAGWRGSSILRRPGLTEIAQPQKLLD